MRRFQNATKDSKERVLAKGPNAGKVVHEEHYSFVEGMITDIQTKDSEYGKSWLVTIQDGLHRTLAWYQEQKNFIKP
ncbi:MAG: hypothetical protein EOO38_09880 [Cytophagaceae bacterium]|nr:MAG: hypothetical protein EOO38_09880 [Cytophagaceae bacterium]